MIEDVEIRQCGPAVGQPAWGRLNTQAGPDATHVHLRGATHVRRTTDPHDPFTLAIAVGETGAGRS